MLCNMIKTPESWGKDIYDSMEQKGILKQKGGQGQGMQLQSLQRK